MTFGLQLTPCIKPNSRWTVDLNMKDKTIKLLRKNIEHLYDLGVGKISFKRFQDNTNQKGKT